MRKKSEILFYKYFQNWIYVYKKGSIRSVSFKKYELSLDWIIRLSPNLKLCDINRMEYQKILNDYAVFHLKTDNDGFSSPFKKFITRCFWWGLNR
nr:hypothetical protein [Mycoplasmopsis cynos]